MSVILKFFTAVCFPVLMQGHAGTFLKTHTKVTLRGKTKVAGDLVVGITGIDQHVLDQLEFFLKNIVADGDSFCLSEKLREIVGIQIQFFCNI